MVHTLDGFDAVPWEDFTQQPPLMDETYYLGGVARPRRLTIGIEAAGRSYGELDRDKALLHKMFNPKFGEGILERRSESGVRRAITALPMGGIRYSRSRQDRAVQRGIVELKAHDPIFYDPVAKTVTFTSGAINTPGTFIYPLVSGSPFRLGSSTINYVADTEFQTNGDWPVFPIFQITGPAAGPLIQNLSLSVTVASGTVAVASTDNTLVATVAVFTADMVGYIILNSTDSEVAVIGAVNNTTTVTLDRNINDTWDGDAFVIKRDNDAKIELDYTIPAGRTVTIDCRPGYKTIENDLGVSLESYLTDDSAFTTWRMLPDPLATDGINLIWIFMGSITNATTIVANWYDRYSGI